MVWGNPTGGPNPYQNAASAAYRQHRYQKTGYVANANELGRNIPGTPVCWKECLYRFGLRPVFPEPESPKGNLTLKNVRLYSF
jgi:hypothetical protein